jgi:farnesyl-diphosphate farnesyltransferase
MLPPRLSELLRQTSRSFHLTLRILPRAVRSQIGLAYLLARTADTIADTDIVPVGDRLAVLEEFRHRIIGARRSPVSISALAAHQGTDAERALLENCEPGLDCLHQLTPEDWQRVVDVLQVIIGGQEQDLRRFAGGSESAIVALATDAELEDYTYRVAGCVGEFWTRICRAHLFPGAALDDAQFVADGVRFGKGLQLVNILRDLPADLRLGRCYLPANGLQEVGLLPADLLNPESEMQLRPFYDRLRARSREHLRAGWRYTNAIPRGQVRVRLACAWPVLIGVGTLSRLGQEPVLNPARRVKLPRAEVRGIVFQSVCRYPFPALWRKQFVD